MADVIITYGPGQTCTNEEEAFAAIPDDVIASGNRYICRSTAFESVRSTRWVPQGKNCDADHNIIFEPAPGAGWTDGGAEVRYDPTKASIKVTGSYTEGVYIAQDWMIFRGFQVWQAGGGNSNAALLCDVSAPNAQLYDNIAQISASGNFVYCMVVAGGTWMRNMGILLGNGGHGVGLNQGGNYKQLSKFTIVRSGAQPGGSGYGFLTYGTYTGTVTIKDSAVMNMAGFCDDPGRLAAASSNNASDGTVGFGTANLDNQIFANTFRDTSAATPDWRLKAGSPLLTGATTGGEIGALVTPSPAASALTLTGAASVTTGYSSLLSLSTDNPLTGAQSEAWAISDGQGGTFSPSSGTLNAATPTVSITYTPSAALGARTVTASATGTPTLANATKAFTVTALVAASALTLAGANTGVVGVAQTITIGADQPLTGSQTESVALSSPGGTFSPSTVTLNAANQSATSQFTPTSSGSKTITAAATGTPTLANATKSIAVALPTPVLVAGQNDYEIGPGRQFANWAAFRTFINAKNLVAAQASVRAVYFGAGETISGDLLPVDANVNYNITLIADLASSYVMAATAQQFHYPNAGTELTFTSLVNVVRGIRLIGFRYNFQGAGILSFGTNYGDAQNSFLSGVATSNSTTVDTCIISGSYQHSLNLEAATFIRTAGSGYMVAAGDGHGTFNGLTFVCTGTATSNGLSFNQYGGRGATIIQNNVFVACGDEPIQFNGTDTINPDNYKNNYTDTAMNPAKLQMAQGMTAITGTPFVLDKATDLRPVIGGPIYHKGNALVTSKNDAFGQNHGQTPDAGAYQREPASNLPTLVITSVDKNGQNVTINVTTTNGPTTVLCSLVPQPGVTPNTAQTVGPIAMDLGVNTAVKELADVQPGSYLVVVSGSHDGGSAVANETFTFKINGINGTPEVPEDPIVPPDDGTVSTITGVTITPLTATDSVQFNAVAQGNNPSQGFTWSKVGGGTLSNTGAFVKPAKTDVVQVITVRATSTQDTSKYAEATVTIAALVVVPPVDTTPVVLAVAVTPTAGIILNGSLDFDAVATGLNNPAQTFDWETDLGAVNVNGTVSVTRTTQAQTGHLTARSTVDPTKFATVTFTVPALDVVIDPPDDGEEIIPVPENVTVSVSRILRTKAENSSLRDGPDVTGDTYMLRQGVWVIMKDKDDSLYYARDVEPLLLAAETTIDSVVAVVEGVEVKQGPTVRGTLIITKIAGGDADMGIDVQNMLTLRIKFGNGEVQDLSIYFGIKER